ncbi:MAG: prolipoprotein diacylglyceryl transferase [Clostridia bacterium]|nr:prolipoprotein diacylglyceryl transferase [Clostridia bacterium]
MTTTVSFPGLGIDSFTLNKVAFTLFGKIEVRWYGIIITLGIVLAFLYACWRGKKNENIIPDDVMDIGLVTVLCGIVGARIYYVLGDSTGVYDSLYDVIAIWNGGIAIYGAIIGGCLGILLMCHIKKISWRKLFDMAAPGVLIAQALGRWGNFFNGEAYGYEITETTRFYFFNKEHVLSSGEGTFFHALRMGLTPNVASFSEMHYFHPTFLYESLWNVLGFVLIQFFYKRKKFDGQVAVLYFTWYGFGRMFIEGLRTDSLYLGNTTLRISQLIGLLCFVGGLCLFIIPMIVIERKKKLAVANADGGQTDQSEEAPHTEEGTDTEQAEQTEQTEQEENQLIDKESEDGKAD